MAIENQRTMTVEEYFQLEANDPETRYEYIDAMRMPWQAEPPIMTPSNQISKESFGIFYAGAIVAHIVLI
jgi:Uma2 family endonuclease